MSTYVGDSLGAPGELFGTLRHWASGVLVLDVDLSRSSMLAVSSSVAGMIVVNSSNNWLSAAI